MAEPKTQLHPDDSDSDLDYSDALEANIDLNSDELTNVKGGFDADDKFFDTNLGDLDDVADDGVDGDDFDGAKVESDVDEEKPEPEVDLLKARQEEEDKLSEEEREVKHSTRSLS